MSDPWSFGWPEVGGLLATGSSVATGIMNYQSQQRAMDIQLELQKEAWNREDSAVQRRVADLKAAGLNPVLAAGSGASSSGPIQVRAPQMDDVGSHVVENMARAQSMHQSQAQVALLAAQAAKVDEERKGVELDNRWKEATISPREAQESAKTDYLLRTLQPRIEAEFSESQKKYFDAAISSINESVLSMPVNAVPATLAPALEKMKLALMDATKAATDARIPLMEAQTGALAYAAQASGMNAEALKKIGIPPLVADAIMKLIGTAAAVIR